MTIDRSQTRQGWIQTAIIVGATMGSVFLAYGKLDARADKALDKATNAENKAAEVEKNQNSANLELVRIRTLLEERLPKKGP